MWWTRPNPKHSTRSCSSFARAFRMSSIVSLDHEIVQLPDTVGVLWVCQTSQRNWVTIKVSPKVSIGLARIETGICHSVWRRGLWAHSVGHHHNVHNVIKELITIWWLTIGVKRLSGNKIEQGTGIPTIESRARTIPVDKGNCIRDWLNPRHRG